MGITLSKKYGLNPSIVTCPVCGKDMCIALLGANRGNEAPRTMKGDELCDDCKKKYVTVIEMCKEHDKMVPTGRRTFVPKEAFNKEFKDNTALMHTEDFVKTFLQ